MQSGISLALALLSSATGCSLILDFSDGAVPTDAAIDSAFSQAECEFKEPNDNAATAAPFLASDVGPAAICAEGFDDHDFYLLTVGANTVVNITINFTTSASGDLDLRLLDKTGANILASSVGFDDQEAITCPGSSPMCNALPADDYIFEVFPAVLGAKNRYDIAVTITP